MKPVAVSLASAADRAGGRRPSLRKQTVVVALFALSMITYVDRVCISSAKEPIVSELHLSEDAMGMVFGAFALGYALAQIPCGWLADRMGPRLALGLVVSAWSMLTAFTGASWNLVSLVCIRFIFGVSEAGAFPGSARAICNWLPSGERGRANGILFSGSRLGGALSFPLLTFLLTRWRWRASFWILGGVGMVWVLLWLVWFRDRPQEAPPGTELNGPGLDLSQIFRSEPMMVAMIQYFCSNFTFFIGLSWMLPYLKSQFHLADGPAAAFAMAPLLAGTLSQWISGWLVDALYRSPYRRWSRRLPAILGFTISVAGLLLLTKAASPGSATACFTLAVFGSDMTVSPGWVFCADIAGKNAGSVSGAMNMIGNLGSFVSATAFPVLATATGSASAYFLVAAILNSMGILCWLRMRPPETVQ